LLTVAVVPATVIALNKAATTTMISTNRFFSIHISYHFFL
jgi:hypothetical protein